MELVNELLEALFNVEICAKRFAEYKKQLVRHWRNSNQNKPVSELFSILGAQIMPWNPEPNALAQALKDTSFHQFNCFRNEFFKALHVESFLHGNWQRSDALKFQKQVTEHLAGSTTIIDLTRPLNDITEVGQQRFMLNCSDHAMVLYYQAQTDDTSEKVQMMVLNHLINQDYFNELRTKQQLGYLVGAGYAPFNTRAGIAFYVQSPKHSADEILQRHQQFINNYVPQVNSISEQQWLDTKAGLVTHIAEKDKNLRLRSQRLWLAIGNRDTEFNMQRQLLEALDKLSLAQMQQYITETFSENRPRIELLSEPKAKKQPKTTLSSHSL